MVKTPDIFTLTKNNGNVREEITVERITNGWLTIRYKNWSDPESGYKSETLKTFSKGCPIKGSSKLADYFDD